VFFATPDRLLPDDTDESMDIYRAAIEGATATLARVSTGSGDSGNTDDCDPAFNQQGTAWNNVAGAQNCDAVAFAGGTGVSSATGTVYFLSPERLDGNGVDGEPNLFVAAPGSAPRLVATLDATNPAIRAAVSNNEARTFGDFQTTSTGEFAVFASRLPLAGFPTAGRLALYRYDASEGVQCVTCASVTGATPSADVSLSRSGLNLSEDGRVFFTSRDQLVLRDANGRADAYQWSDGETQLISTGIDSEDSGILSVSADGVNAYFFTRARIVPEDENASAMKIYVAREGGGFPFGSPPFPCAAADECRGAATTAPAPPAVGTYRGVPANARQRKAAKRKCQKGKVKRQGRCVKKKRKKRRRARRRSRR
jgi:hypothetical protein